MRKRASRRDDWASSSLAAQTRSSVSLIHVMHRAPASWRALVVLYCTPVSSVRPKQVNPPRYSGAREPLYSPPPPPWCARTVCCVLLAAPRCPVSRPGPPSAGQCRRRGRAVCDLCLVCFDARSGRTVRLQTHENHCAPSSPHAHTTDTTTLHCSVALPYLPSYYSARTHTHRDTYTTATAAAALHTWMPRLDSVRSTSIYAAASEQAEGSLQRDQHSDRERTWIDAWGKRGTRKGYGTGSWCDRLMQCRSVFQQALRGGSRPAAKGTLLCSDGGTARQKRSRHRGTARCLPGSRARAPGASAAAMDCVCVWYDTASTTHARAVPWVAVTNKSTHTHIDIARPTRHHRSCFHT